MKRRFVLTSDVDCLLDLTAGQHTPFGNLVGSLYYSKYGRQLLELAPYRGGYPHNGGEHTLYIRGSVEDVCAWFDLLIDRYKQISSVQSVLTAIQLEITCVLKGRAK